MTSAPGFVWVAVGGLVVAAVVAAWLARSPAPPPAPYALWRDGRIVGIRHCEPPVPDAARADCAWLACAESVTNRMVNPMEARLRPLPATPGTEPGTAMLAGTIDYRTTLAQPPLRAFECRVRGTRLLETTLLPGG